MRGKVDRAEAGEKWKTHLMWASISGLRKLDTNLNMKGVAGSNIICLTFIHITDK